MKYNTTLITFTCIIISIIVIFLLSEKIARYTQVKPAWKKLPYTGRESGKVIIYTSYNKSYANQPFVELNSKILSKYCEFNDHEYRHIIHDDDFMSPYWTRVYDLKKICESTPDNTIIMYMDADAIPSHFNKNVSINQLIENLDHIHENKTRDIYISEDPEKVHHWSYNGIFNTGCFIVRNTEKSRKFIDKWMGKYNKGSKWVVDETGKWVCLINGKICTWSQDGYEQGEFSKLYSSEGKDIIQYLHWTTLACNVTSSENCFVLHLMSYSNKNREEIFKYHLGKYLE